MAEERQVHATLDFSLGSGVEKASKDMVAGMAKIAKAYTDIQTAAERAAKATNGPAVIGGLTGSAADALARARGQAPEGRFGRFSRGLGDSADAIGGAMGRFGGPAAVGAAAATAASAAGSYQALASDRYYTEAQRQRKVLMDLPGVGHAARLGEAFAGRSGAMLDINVAAEKQGLGQQTYAQLQGVMRSEKLPQFGRESLALSTAAASPINGTRIDRSSATGELAFREQSRLLPVMREQAKIERQIATATDEKQLAEKKYLEAVGLEQDAIKRRNKAAAEVDKNSDNDFTRLRQLRELENANAGVMQASEETKANRENLRAKQLAEGGLRGQSLENRAQFAEARAGNLEDRASTAAGSAQRLGGQNPYDRTFGVQALKALQQYGPDAIPAEMLSAAQQFAPQTVAKLLEKHGAGTAEYQEGQQIAPADYTGNPEELRQKAEDARREATQARLEAEKTLTQVAADSGKDFGAFLERIIRTQLEVAKSEIENRLRLQRSNTP